MSWVIRERATGRVICETFSDSDAKVVMGSRYEAIPIRDYLAGLNRAIKDGAEDPAYTITDAGRALIAGTD